MTSNPLRERGIILSIHSGFDLSRTFRGRKTQSFNRLLAAPFYSQMTGKRGIVGTTDGQKTRHA